jgi:hypothetical protein
MQTIELSAARITLELRPAYVLVSERGTLTTEEDVARYADAVQAKAIERGVRCVLVDARAATAGHELRAMLAERWHRSRCFDRIAWVVSGAEDAAGTQARTQALSRGILIRTFATQQDAHRWLLTKVRGLSGTMPAIVPPAAKAKPVAEPTPERGGMRPPSAGGADTTNIAARPRREDVGSGSHPMLDDGARPTPLGLVRPSQRLMKAAPSQPVSAPPADAQPADTQPADAQPTTVESGSGAPNASSGGGAAKASNPSGVRSRGAVREIIERSGSGENDPR